MTRKYLIGDNNKMKLFCIPYAGGSATIYNRWNRYLTDEIELIPIELVGRGHRMKEPFYPSFDHAVQDIQQVVTQKLGCDHFALFGHSMGALLAYETAVRMDIHVLPQMQHLFLSGCFPPIYYDSIIYKRFLDDPEQYVKNGGKHLEMLLQNRQLFDLFFPVLQADFSLLSKYRLSASPYKLKCNISIFYGSDEDICDEKKLCEWNEITEGHASYHMFHGDHLFLLDQYISVIETIVQTLKRYKR